MAPQHLEQTSLVPMWLPLTCPNVTNLECSGGAITDHLPLPAPPPPRSATTASPAPAPVACQHLHRLDLSGTERLGAQHLRQQLAALPSLSTLNLWDSLRMAAELHSTSVTHLAFLYDDEDSRVLERLPAQFPNLVEMSAPSLCALDDDGLEALLSVRSLRRVDLWGLRLQRSHAHRPCAWEDLLLWRMDVDSVARLPLEGIRRLCIDGNEVCPSRDAQAVARVAAIVKRSGVLGAKDGVTFSGEDPAALLTTLRPLLAPLPAEQQRRVTIKGMGQEATPEVVRQVGQQLPPAVHTLELAKCSCALDTWVALLPSLPATVTRLQLGFGWPAPPQMEEHVVAVCAGAVRPITVAVCFTCVEEQQRILSQLAERGNTHVTLEWLG